MLDYFYGEQSEQFSFYRIPKVLFTDPYFRELSSDAKILYGLLLDRMNLSARNGWMDEQRRVYIVFTTEEVMDALGCGDQKVTKLFGELEKKCGLIERKRLGLGRPSLIYVKNFIQSESPSAENQKSRIQNRDFHDSGAVKTTIQEPRKSRCNNTEINNTDLSDTDPIFSSGESEITDESSPVSDELAFPVGNGKEEDGMRQRALYQNYFEKTLQVNRLIEENPDEEETVLGILELLVDTCCTKRQWIRVAGDDHPAEVVKGRFMKLEARHIRYVLKCLMENTTKIRNMKQYLLAALYNAPTTVSSYYQAWVNSDLAAQAKD